MSKSTGNGTGGISSRLAEGIRKLLQRIATETVSIDFSGTRLIFVCNSRTDSRRAKTIWVKERGTITWMKKFLKPGDIFLDIGANIGVYSLLAAKLVGPSGKVYAIEPHATNVVTLLQNIAANKLSRNVIVLNQALSDQEKHVKFEYTSFESASSGSQLVDRDSTMVGQNIASSIIFATSVDMLLNSGCIALPTHIKIDVDGHEPAIVRGMSNLISDPSMRPRTIQVEVTPSNLEGIRAQFLQAGYRELSRHYTMVGEKLADISRKSTLFRRLTLVLLKRVGLRGKSVSERRLEDYPYNVIFVDG